MHSPLIPQAIFSRNPPKRVVWDLLLWWADYASRLVGCQVQPCMEAAGCCLAGSGHEVAGSGTLRGPRASIGSLVGGSRVLKTLGLLSTYWEVKPGSGLVLVYWQPHSRVQGFRI